MSYYVYFVQAGRDGPIKIGVAWSVPQRVRELQVASWEELHVIGDVRCSNKESAFALEAALHERLRKFHMRGEWYVAADEVTAAIRDPDPEGDVIEAPPWADEVDRQNLARLSPSYRRRVIEQGKIRYGDRKA